MTKLRLRPVAVVAALSLLAIGAPALAGAQTASVATTPSGSLAIHMTAPTTTTTVAPSVSTKSCKASLRHYGVAVSAWNRQRNAILSAYVTAKHTARNGLTTALVTAKTSAQLHGAHVAFSEALVSARLQRDAALTALGAMPKRPDC